MWLSSKRDLSSNLKAKLESVALCQYAFCSAGRVSSQVHARYLCFDSKLLFSIVIIIVFQIITLKECIKILFFIFKKFIFDIITSKRYENTEKNNLK
jgi:hypothetical protein